MKAAALLASWSNVFEGVRKVESPKQNLNMRIKEPKTIQRTISSFHKMENLISSVVKVIEILG